MLKYKSIIEKLTLLEKASLCSGKDFWTTLNIDRLNIPSIFLSDGPHGLRKQDGESDNLGIGKSIPATCFPTAVSVANSWDKELGELIGQTIGIEANYQNVNVVLGPGTNIKRSPLCGRNFEYFSEDPFLAGKLASSYIRGIQSQNVASCIKHFACNNQELNRQTLDSVVDERTLREIYLRPFEIAIKESDPKCIMSSYNLVNGQYTNENPHLLIDILRNEWGYKGVVVTDWGGNNDRVEGLKCFNELEMPSSNGDGAIDIINAVNEGRLDESILDRNVDNLLDLIFTYDKKDEQFPPFDVNKHHDIALKAIQESAVLLKNDGILPINKDTKVAFIGDFIYSPRYQGAGSSIVNPTKLDIPLDCLNDEFNNIVGISKGFNRLGKKSNKLIKEAIKIASKADVIVTYLGLDEISEAEGLDRQDMSLKQNQLDLIKSLKTLNKPLVVVLSNGSAIELPFNDDVNAILLASLSGQAGAKGILSILKGDINPSGKLSETYLLTYQDSLSSDFFPSLSRVALYKEGLYVGYRYFDKANIEVRYPFGHGLSYTKFRYSNLSISDLGVSLSLSNIGKYKGKEIVELYIGKNESNIIRPIKELKGFIKVELDVNETKDIFIPFDEHSFTFFNIKTNQYEIEGGTYSIYVGASSQDIRLEGEINKEATSSNLDDHRHLDKYMSGDIRNITDQEYARLLGRDIPSGELNFINKKKNRIVVHYNTTIDELKYAKGFFGRFFYFIIQIVIKLSSLSKDKAWANTLSMGIKYQPMRGISRMTGGTLRWSQLNGLIDAFNGQFFKGIHTFIKEGRKYKKEKKLIKKQSCPKYIEKIKEKERKAKLKAMSKEERKTFLLEEKNEHLKAFELSEIEHFKNVKEKRNQLIQNNKSTKWHDFTQLGLWQVIRKWWSRFSYIHPKASKNIYEVVFFFVFSISITLWQFLVMLFLPYAFTSLASTPFVWPEVTYTWFDGATLTWAIFNDPVNYGEAGEILIGGGLGNFIAFEIAVFTAQCINFPLQRNITFKSHGNPWWQGMWYFIGWVLISLAVNALWGFVGPISEHYLINVWEFGNAESLKWITDLLKTFITGFISMIIFFFIFKIIFPSDRKKKE